MPKVPQTLFSAVSMAADATSTIIDISDFKNVSIQLNFTGTPTGSFLVQVSDFPNPSASTDWIDVELESSVTAAGSDDQIGLDIPDLNFKWLRVFYDRTSGTGTLTGYGCFK